MTNPLLDTSALPRFDDLKPEHVQPALEKLIAAHRRKLAELLADDTASEFESLVAPLEEMSHELSRVWSPVSHLQGVLDDSQWREAYNAALPLLTEHATELSQNSALFEAYRRVAESLPDDASPAMRSLVDKELRDFRLAGVALVQQQKDRFRALMQELATTQATFDQNIRDATDAWHLQLSDEHQLAGLPTQIVARAKNDARSRDEQGWWLGLDLPTYQAVMTHADDRGLRETFYAAWSTRASDQGQHTQWDNSELIEKILGLRHEAAQLIGFGNYAEYSLATKMAASVDEVLDFLTELAERTRKAAKAELDAVREMADQALEAWDVAYYVEKLKQKKYSVSDEALRQYFPAAAVSSGLFGLVEKLYGIRVAAKSDVRTWHESVGYYELRDGSGELLGSFYTDLYARNGKRSGAWMDECVIRKRLHDHAEAPVGYLVCNFTPPDANGVSLLTHNDVLTFFHEFGHMLHHLLTRVDYPSIAGINGVPWDAVELPSQFMENFAWHYEVLRECSRHFETGEALPQELFDRLHRSRHFGEGLAMLRQLEFALFDFRLHAYYDPSEGSRVLEVLKQVREEVAVVKHPAYNRLPHSFSHIFAGGYAAGYYSYKWAEVLAADAFSAFEEAGIFDPGTAQRFRREILEVGGSRDIMEAYIAFRGRKPTLDALLRMSGIDQAA
ncbi:MAG: M3 family metallopeptidase [Woeseiaceae bacterium]|nr:M3 family metallopeptidase [Woeseiaceae bacterium]